MPAKRSFPIQGKIGENVKEIKIKPKKNQHLVETPGLVPKSGGQRSSQKSQC
jgi:hypothetical protein